MGVKKNVIDFLGSSCHFPDFLIVDPQKSPLGPPWDRVVTFLRFEYLPDLSAYMRAKFGCDPTVVLKRQTARHTARHARTHAHTHARTHAHTHTPHTHT